MKKRMVNKIRLRTNTSNQAIFLSGFCGHRKSKEDEFARLSKPTFFRIFSVLFTLLLAALAFADVPYDSTYPPANTSANFTRYHDFPLDNIHILRLQDASMALGRNVSVLHDQLADYQAQQANQISGMQASIDSLQRAMNMQVSSLEQTVKKLDKPIPVPEPNNTPFNLLFLSNLILFGIVVVLLVVVHRKPSSEDHIRPAPPELVHYINTSRKAEHELRLELVAKGWKPSHIENALKIAKK